MPGTDLARRDWLKGGALGAAAAVPGSRPSAAADAPRGKAEACILLWLGGGAAQIDTFDPKRRGDGKKTPGCYYETIPTPLPGVRLCEHLPRLARSARSVRARPHAASQDHRRARGGHQPDAHRPAHE